MKPNTDLHLMQNYCDVLAHSLTYHQSEMLKHIDKLFVKLKWVNIVLLNCLKLVVTLAFYITYRHCLKFFVVHHSVYSLYVSCNCGSKKKKSICEVRTESWHCRHRVSSCNVYAVQQDTQSVSMSEFYSSRMLARHVSDLTGSPSGAYLQIWYVVIRVLLDTSTCRVVRVLPHTKSAHTACK